MIVKTIVVNGFYNLPGLTMLLGNSSVRLEDFFSLLRFVHIRVLFKNNDSFTIIIAYRQFTSTDVTLLFACNHFFTLATTFFICLGWIDQHSSKVIILSDILGNLNYLQLYTEFLNIFRRVDATNHVNFSN